MVPNTTSLGTTALSAWACTFKLANSATLPGSCTAAFTELATVDCTAFSILAICSMAAKGLAAVDWVINWALPSLSLSAAWPTTVARASPLFMVTADALRAWVKTVVTALAWLKSKPVGFFWMEVIKLATTASEKSSEPAFLAP